MFKREKREKQRISYTCELLGKTARITLEYLYHNSGFKALVGFDCQDRNNCGVGKEVHPGGWTFDWSKCVHPSAKR